MLGLGLNIDVKMIQEKWNVLKLNIGEYLL